MFRKISLAFILSLFVFATLLAANSQGESHRGFVKNLDKLRRMVRIPALSYAVIYKGKLILAGGLGKQNIAQKINATAQTKYPIASLTKLFTANLLLQLEAEGRVNLQKPVSTIIKQLRIGLQLTNLNRYSLVEILAHRHDSGGYFFRYNPTSYHEITPLIPKLTGVSFATSLLRRFFLPLGMTSTYPGLNDNNYATSGAAVCYRLRKKGGYSPSKRSSSDLSGAYGVVSTVKDLAKYEIALQNLCIASPTMQSNMFSPLFVQGIAKSGVGWFLDDYLGEKIAYHYGWRINSCSALYLRLPKKKLAFILLANSEMLSAPFGLHFGSIISSPFALLFLRTFLEGRKDGLVSFGNSKQFLDFFLYQADKVDDQTARYYLLGRALLEKYRRRWRSSIYSMSTILNRYPYDLSLANYGNLLFAMRNKAPLLTVAAKRMLFYLRGKSPKNPRLLYYSGLWLYRDGKIAEAVKYFEKVASNAASPPVMRCYSGYFAGLFYFKDDRNSIKAYKYLKIALELGLLTKKDHGVAFLKWLKFASFKELLDLFVIFQSSKY